VSALDKVLLAADLLEPAALGGDEAHEHLMKQCPWYRNVCEGKNCWHDPGEHCKPGDAKQVKLTPRTPEASTVPEPIGKPGGPGLWHVKGMQLPPYVQHLAHHLIGKYGESRGIAMAKGIVAKWAKGVAPGGKKGGKTRHTHPDVRAAATKAIAQWEEKRGEAHAQSREHDKVRASAAQPWQDSPFPGQKQIPLPPVPGAKTARAMYTAHRLNDCIFHLSHAAQRLDQARQGKALRGYHMIHVNNHLSHSLDDIHNLVASVRKNYLPEARELDALGKTMGLAKSVSTDAKVATFAHLLQTLLYHLAHAKRHAELMLDPDPDAVWRFNYDHAHTHLKGAVEHVYKLVLHVEDNYPEETRWLGDLAKAEDPHDPFTGLTGVQLAVTVATAPGAQPIQAGPYARPSQTVSPSPPLPPAAKLPTAAEIRKIAGQVPDCTDQSLSQSARNHLEAAAVKLEKDDEMAALHMLRSAQSDIYAAHKADLGMAAPAVYTANVFTRVPSAEQSSANTAMLRSKDREMAWRRLEFQVATAVDRIRRRHFHGMYQGSPLARFTGESAVARVLRLRS
jgi:hypothetical protein